MRHSLRLRTESLHGGCGLSETTTSQIEAAFKEFTERHDIGILLINQHVADQIRPLVEKYEQAFPALLEIPSKDHPYGLSHKFVVRNALLRDD